MTASEIAAALDGKTSGDGWMAHCPAHDDDNPSLSISEKDGKVLVRCHAGCAQENVVAALSARGLWNGNGKGRDPREATYIYRDAEGSERYRKERFYINGKKAFAFKHIEAGGIVEKRGGPALLYRLPELLAALSAGQPVAVTEGEKDVETLATWGIPATCNDGGADNWKPELAEAFPRGSRVLIVPDNDQAGKKYLDDVGRSLVARGCEVQVVALDRKDVTEWKEAGHTREELVDRIVQARPFSPAVAERVSQLPDYSTSEGSPEERLARLMTKGCGLADIASREYPAQRWVVSRIMPEVGFGVLAAPTKAGKTWICLQLTSAVSLGLAFLGNESFITSRCEVLFLALQVSDRQLHDRMESAGILADNRVIVYHVWPKGQDALDAIREWKRLHPACGLVIVDMLQQVRHQDPEHEHSYAVNVDEVTAWTKLAQDLGIFILATAHNRKGESLDWVSDIMSSVGIAGSASTLWSLKRSRGKADAVLHVTGWELLDDELPLVFNSDGGGWSLLEGTASQHRNSEERQAVTNALGKLGEAGPKDIAEATGRTIGSVKMMLARLVDEGKAKRLTRGKYTNVTCDFVTSVPKGNEVMKSSSNEVTENVERDGLFPEAEK